MSELPLSLLVALAASLLALGALWGVFDMRRRVLRERERGDDLQQELELVRQSISALTAGTVGMDRRMQRVEARERVLSERQETYEIQQADAPPYGHAIRLVQQGAGIMRLVEELDISESEADLIVRLHGDRDTA